MLRVRRFVLSPLLLGAAFSALTSVASAQSLPLAGAKARAVALASSGDSFGGVRTSQTEPLSDRVVRYEIEASLDPKKHTIEGKEKLTWRNRSDREVQTLYLHLYLNAFEGEGSTFMTERKRPGFGFRSRVPFREDGYGRIELRSVKQGDANVPFDFVQPDGGPKTDRTVVRLQLPTKVGPGETITLSLEFFDQLPRVLARTGYYETFHLVAQWFPKVGVLELPGERGATEPRWNCHEFHLNSEFYADFGTFDVRLRVPKGFRVGATGKEVDAPKSDGTEHVIHHFEQDDVHDFAWTADSRTAPPYVRTEKFPSGAEVEIRVLFPPELADHAEPVYQATRDALRFYSQYLGEYPYRTITAVVPPWNAGEAGGMEYPTFFTADAVGDVSKNTLERYFLDFVTVHEFGHNYFYGLLASNEFEEPLLDEGLNEYTNARLIEALGRGVPLQTRGLRLFGVNASASPFLFERIGAVSGSPLDPLGENSWNRISSASFSSVYSRTAALFRDFETMLGQDVVDRALRLYYERFRFRHPSTADLRDCLSEVSGKKDLVERVFREQVFDTLSIEDRIESFSSEESLPLLGGPTSATPLTLRDRDAAIQKAKESGKTGSNRIPYRTEVVVSRNGALVPKRLTVRFADGSKQTAEFEDDARWRRFTFDSPSKALEAEFEGPAPYLLEENHLDNSQRLDRDSRATRHLLVEMAAFLETAVSLLWTL